MGSSASLSRGLLRKDGLNGNLFYCKESVGDYRWERPLDAVNKADALEKCTCMIFGEKRVKQAWYVCEDCNKEFKVKHPDITEQFPVFRSGAAFG